jgi:hypothetical protein
MPRAACDCLTPRVCALPRWALLTSMLSVWTLHEASFTRSIRVSHRERSAADY